MTVIHYSSSSDSDYEIGFKEYEDTVKENENIFQKKSYLTNTSDLESTKKFSLPAPKKKLNAPPPPEPIKVIQPVVAEARKEMKEDKEVIEVNAEDLQQKDLKVAEDNAMVKNKTMYRGVGRQRAKSQLTYLSEVYANETSEFESKSRKIANAKSNAAKMYGW